MNAKPFRFKENRIPLDLNGHQVYLPVKILRDAILESTKNQIPACQKILAAGDTKENVEQCAEILADWHRALLGEEIFNAVFMSRNTTFPDYCDCYRYLCDAVQTFCNERVKGLTADEPSDQ